MSNIKAENPEEAFEQRPKKFGSMENVKRRSTQSSMDKLYQSAIEKPAEANKHDFTDCRLEVEGEIFNFHSVILASKTEYYRAIIFGTEVGQGFKNGKPIFEGCDENATIFNFRKVLQYAYDQPEAFDFENVSEILSVLVYADFVLMESYANELRDFIAENMAFPDLKELLLKAVQQHDDALVEIVKKWITKNHDEVVRKFDLKDVNREAFEVILDAMDGHVYWVNVVKMYKEWAKHNGVTNEPYIEIFQKKIFHQITFHEVSIDTLKMLSQIPKMLPATIPMDQFIKVITKEKEQQKKDKDAIRELKAQKADLEKNVKTLKDKNDELARKEVDYKVRLFDLEKNPPNKRRNTKN